ncbi:TetR/AcrR family transcriptional regulator [Gordonia neofelifaecis]|uniref:Transcriptional regulator n=1 Tax=Gordonia neofelifaecis NRRL B-59395 TaxID=644548 RepID=F1YMB7_9ACTN|nr:TetR/AcrR family transcriptional regulator [Gordonia neofelifaecis]EGD54166.1 transcriptional regulator [Gordonia neofelifaecis NRRL B-59395]
MPKISADSLAEHREAVLSALMDGTVRILLSDGERRLTAASVAAEAGIARNSIYRYVSSVDDLVELVVARGFQEWTAQVRADVDAARDPRAAVVAYVRSNLTLAASGEHALQSSLAGAGLSDSARERMVDFHRQITAVLTDAVGALGARQPELIVVAIQSLVDSALGLVGPGEDSEQVIDFMADATRAILETR